jgi:inward rectifier potassium channel
MHRRSDPPQVDFSNKPPPRRRRITEAGRARGDLVRLGLSAHWSEDLYHRTLRLTWPAFLLLIAGAYLVVNVVFATLFFLQAGSITNARPGFFRDAFFFSVETFGTIGYGVLAPATDYANILMTLETLVGLTFVALTTGVMFARISRPTARVLFANVAVVTPHDGVPTLMVRIGNERPNQILEAEVSVTLLREETSTEGRRMRRFYDLKLERAHTPTFALSFTVMHKIDKASPLYGHDTRSLDAVAAELLMTVTGLDETSAQALHARHSFLPEDIRFGHAYADIFGMMKDGRRAIDYGRFHMTEVVSARAEVAKP